MVSLKQNMRFLGIIRLIHQSLVYKQGKLQFFLAVYYLRGTVYSTSEYYKSNCWVCLALSMFLGNGIKPSQRHLPSKFRATLLLTCASTKSMVYSSFTSSFGIPMVSLALMESKLAYLEEFKHLVHYFNIQFPKIFQASHLINFYPNR